jgi:hypothetical protein
MHFHNTRVLSADLWSWWCNIFPHDTHIKTIMVDDITNHNNTFIYILSLSDLIKLDGWGNKINHFMVFEKIKKRKSFEMWSSNTFCVFRFFYVNLSFSDFLEYILIIYIEINVGVQFSVPDTFLMSAWRHRFMGWKLFIRTWQNKYL